MTKARDLANAGTALTTVSATELGYLDGVTSAVQTQLNAKQPTVANVSDTEIGYLDGVTSAIQTQLDAKLATTTAASTYAPLTSATLTTPTVNNAVLKSPEERFTISATAATGTIAFDTQTQGVLYYTSNASGNFTLNFTNVNANLATGDAITCIFLNTNGGTAYYCTTVQVDGSTRTVKWSGGTAPAAGNASSIDAYSFTIAKTADATFTILGAGAVKYA